MLTAPNLDLPVTLLKVGRWDRAFDVVWEATRRIPEFQDDATLPGRAQALTVRDSGNHALGREFAQKMADFTRSKKQIPLSICWQMLAADVTKPTTILVFVAQLTQIVSMDRSDMTPLERAAVQNALEVWMDAAEGKFTSEHTLSLFTLQHTAQRERIAAPPKRSYSQTFDEPLVIDLEPAIPGIVVMPTAPVGKFSPENTAYKELVNKWMPLTVAPDLAPIRLRCWLSIRMRHPPSTCCCATCARASRSG